MPEMIPDPTPTDIERLLESEYRYALMCHKNPEAVRGLIRRVVAAERRAEAGDKFKAFCHAYLTAHSVPEDDPDNEHSKAGCRIGARLDLLFAERDAAVAEAAALREALERHAADDGYESGGEQGWVSNPPDYVITALASLGPGVSPCPRCEGSGRYRRFREPEKDCALCNGLGGIGQTGEPAMLRSAGKALLERLEAAEKVCEAVRRSRCDHNFVEVRDAMIAWEKFRCH